MAVDQSVHLARRGADEADRLRQFILDRAPGLGLQTIRAVIRQGGDQGVERAQTLLQLAGEAHHIDQGRAQVVRDDIGEALDLLVGAAEVLSALDDPSLQPLVQTAQQSLGSR